MKNLITDQTELNTLCQALRLYGKVAVDTEFIREKTYWPDLCLIQVACEAGGAAIDPLAGLDLTPFLDILTDPSIIKIFHAARQDLEIFHKLMGALPAPIADTQIMGLALGYADQMAYDRMVNAVLGRSLNKGSRFTDWRKRPLTDAQLDYALADVTHLLDAYNVMSERIEQQGRTEWLADEYAALLNPENYDVNPNNAWQRVKCRTEKPDVLGRLQAVAAWREQQAQARNLPRLWVMKDEVLTEIALSNPRDHAALQNIRGLGKMSADAADHMLQLLARAAPIHQPPVPDARSAPEAVVELLRVLMAHVAQKDRINPRLLGNGSDLQAFALGDADCKLRTAWRRDVFGTMGEGLINGALLLGIEKGKLSLSAKNTSG